MSIRPLEQLRTGLRVRRERDEALLERRSSAASEIAAVDRRHVAGMERCQRRGVAPIEEVPFDGARALRAS